MGFADVLINNKKKFEEEFGTNQTSNFAETLINNKRMMEQNIASTVDTLNSVEPTVKANTKTKETTKTNDKNIWQKLGYIGESLGSGIVGGATQMINAPYQNAQEGAEKAQNKSIQQNAQELFYKNMLPGGLGRIPENINELNEIANDSTKNNWQKLFNMAMETANNLSIAGKLEDAGQLYGFAQQLLNRNGAKDIQKGRDILQTPQNLLQQDVAKKGEDLSKGWKLGGQVAQATGNMLPSIGLSLLTGDPSSAAAQATSLASMGVSAKGQATEEALNKGANLSEANRIGATKGMVEVGTEKLTGGLSWFGKGSLDNIAEKVINDNVKNSVANFVLKKVLGGLGEVGEEVISDIAGIAIDKATTDPNANVKNYFKNGDFWNTVITTLLTTGILETGYDVAGKAITGKSAYQINKQELAKVGQVQDMVNQEISNMDTSKMSNQEINNLRSQLETKYTDMLEQGVRDIISQADEEAFYQGKRTSGSELQEVEQQDIKDTANALNLEETPNNIDENIEENTEEETTNETTPTATELELDLENQTQNNTQNNIDVTTGLEDYIKNNNITELTDKNIEDYINEYIEQQGTELNEQERKALIDDYKNQIKEYAKDNDIPVIESPNIEIPDMAAESKEPSKAIGRDIKNEIKRDVNKFNAAVERNQYKVGNQVKEQYKNLETKSINKLDNDALKYNLLAQEALKGKKATETSSRRESVQPIVQRKADVSTTIGQSYARTGDNYAIANAGNKKTKLNKQKLISDFKKLTGDSKLVADAKMGNYAVQKIRGNNVEAPYSKEAMDLYELIENSKKTSSYLYHSTPIDRIASIVKNGLKVGSKQNQQGISSKDKLYLSANEELAQSFTPNEQITLRIKPSANLENLDYDLLGGEGSYTITNDIDPKYLQVKENGKWINLLDSKYAKVENTQKNVYNDMKVGDIKNIPTNEVLKLKQNDGGYRTEEQVKGLREKIIRDNGVKDPIEISYTDGKYKLEDGNHRLQIAKELGFKEVPVKLVKGWEEILDSYDNGGQNGQTTKGISRENEDSRSGKEMLSKNTRVLENKGTTNENARISKTESNSIKQESSNESNRNNRQNIKELDNSSFNLTQKEQQELQDLKDLESRIDLTPEEQTRMNELEKKSKGIVTKYPDLKTNNKFEDIKDIYGKYKNSEISKENDKILKQAKDIVPGNKQNRRTIDEWKQVAEYIGSNANIKSSQDLQKLAMETWFEQKPNNPSVLNRQGKKYVKFGVDDWVNSVYKGAGVGTEVNLNENKTQNKDKIKQETAKTPKTIANEETLQNEASKRATENNKILNEAKKDDVLKLTTDKDKKINLKQSGNDIYERVDTPNAKDVFPDTSNSSVTIGDKKVSNFYSNITEKSKFITEENRESLKDNENLKYYNEINNKDTLLDAMGKLDMNPEQQVGDFFTKEKFDAEDVATGWILIKRYQDAGNYDGMTRVIEKMREQGTKSGQAIQMYGMLQRLTPEGMEYYAQRQLDEAYDKFTKNKSKKQIEKYAQDFTLTAEEHQFIQDQMEKVNKATDDDTKKVELAKIVRMLSDKLPPEKGQGLKAWMRISMLGNPKTQVRNVMGNAIIQPVNWVGDIFSTAVDKAIAKKTGVRTKGNTDFAALAGGFVKGAKESIRDAKLGVDTRDINLNRFEENIGAKPFYEKGKSKVLNAGAKVLNKTNEILGNVMSGGDRIFYQSIYDNSLKNQMKANGVDTPTQEMMNIAEQEALSRTWNDSNEYTKAVLQIRNAMNKLNIKGYGLGDVLVPFAKTPANLTKAIVDYSPAGLVRSILQDGKNLKNSLENGQYSPELQHKFADSLGKGFAGTILYVAAYALAKAGITTGASDDDKDVANFMRNTLGIQPYSIKIGNKSFTYDWAQPIAAPFAITADAVRLSKKENQDLESIIKTGINSASNILLEQSFLSSIQDVFNNYNGPAAAIQEQIEGLPARATPTFFKQVADLIDPKKRQTYVKGNEKEYIKNQVISKIPGATYSLETQKDTLGRDVEKYGGNEDYLKYAFNVFLNPANTQKGKRSEAAEEIYAVYSATGDKTVMPRQVGYSESVNGQTRNLTAEERNKWQEKSGQLVEKNVSGLKNNSKYQAMSDEDKAAVIQSIVNYSYNKAKSEVFDTNISTQYKTAAKKEAEGIAIYDYYVDRISKRK